MSEQAGPPSKQVQAVKQVQELIKDGDDAVIVGVFSSEQDAAYELYIEACKCSRMIVSAFIAHFAAQSSINGFTATGKLIFVFCEVADCFPCMN